ncbi:MAG: GspE/PulE family protein [Planctomycetota bacterium]
MARSFSKRLLRILEQDNLLDADRLKGVADKAARDKVSVASILVRDGLFEENALLGIMARRMRVVPVNLHDLSPDPDVVKLVPKDLAKNNNLLALSRIGNVLTVAVSNPFDVVKLDDVRITTGCEVRLVLSLEETIQEALDRVYNPGEAELRAVMGEMGGDHEIEVKESDLDSIEELDLEAIQKAGDDESPVIKFVNLIIYGAIKEGASDIHIEPFEKHVLVRFRVDGLCNIAHRPPKALQNSIVSRIKIMSSLDIAERRRPQDGKFQIRIEGRQVDFRVSVLPTVHGEKVVMRILDASSLALSLDRLGFEERALADFRNAIQSSYGMILVTGPTGSGKSTTLYSAVKEILCEEMNFVTVEDPVEYQVHGVNQVQVSEKRGMTFAAGLRSILRQDPDVVMVGEIRDTETIEIAIKAALTGHLVLSTLHTNDAASSITRMVDMGVDPFMVSSSTLLVSAQRLARRLCRHCRKAVKAPTERLLAVGFTKKEAKDAEIFTANGCGRCKQGYAGRFALLETLPMTEEIQRMVIEGQPALEIKQFAMREQGMISLRRCGLLNALRGNTSLEEVLRVTMPDTVRPGLKKTTGT